MKYWLILMTSLILNSGGGGELFTLKKCEEYALKHNRQILAALQESKKASLGHIMTWQYYLPKVSTSFTYTLAEKLREFEMPPDSPFGQLLSLAGPVVGEVPSKFVIDFTYDYTVNLNIVQPVFNTQIIMGIGTSYFLKRAAEEKVRQVKNEVIYRVRTLFYQVLLAEKLVEVTRESLKLAQEQLRVAEAKFNAGEATEFEVLRNKVEVANAKVSLIQAENNLKRAKLYLAITLGLNTAGEIEISGQLTEAFFTGTVDEYIEKAMEMRPELKALEYMIKAKKREALSSVLNYVPSLGIVGNVNLYTNEFSGKWQKDYSFLLALQWDILSGGTKITEKKMLDAEIESLREKKKLLEDSVKAEVKEAFLLLEKARETLEATRETVKTAQRSVEIAQERYRNGLMTSLELMDAQIALRRAKTAYYSAIFAYRQAVEKVYLSAGIIDQVKED